jgi:hypothetical protein
MDFAPILLVAARNDGVTVIAEGHGWSRESSLDVGTPADYRVIERPDGSLVPVFVPFGNLARHRDARSSVSDPGS